MKKVLILLVSLAVLGAGFMIWNSNKSIESAGSKSKYIGIQYQPLPYPEGTQFLNSAGSGADKFYDNHTLTIMSTSEGQQLWLQRINSRNEKGIPNFTVTDALTMDNPKQNVTAGFCGPLSSSGAISYNPLITAFIGNEQIVDGNYQWQAIRAWKINPVTEKFEEFSAEDIYCHTTDAPPGYSG